jgi:hypothetical protein
VRPGASTGDTSETRRGEQPIGLGLDPAATAGLTLSGGIHPRGAEVLDALAGDLGLLGRLGEDTGAGEQKGSPS